MIRQCISLYAKSQYEGIFRDYKRGYISWFEGPDLGFDFDLIGH